ncbi:MAG TPA: anti-sigma F factor [Bacillota bacterium]
MTEPFKNHVKLEMEALPDNVALARVTVASFATQLDFTLEEVEDIRVAVSEAVTNAVVHAYDGGPGTVVIEAGHDGEALTLTILDHGRGIPDVALARQPAYTTDPERMGLGFAIMESFSDELDVTSAPGRGTTVRMVKRPRAARAHGGNPADARPV